MSKKIKDTGKTQRIISPERVCEALSAEDTGVKIDTTQGAISLFSLRQVLVGQLRSTGGRPGLEGTGDKRNKIPTIDGDWEQLKKIAKNLREKEQRAISPGQIAAVLIHDGISKIVIQLKQKKGKKAWDGILRETSQKR